MSIILLLFTFDMKLKGKVCHGNGWACAAWVFFCFSGIGNIFYPSCICSSMATYFEACGTHLNEIKFKHFHPFTCKAKVKTWQFFFNNLWVGDCCRRCPCHSGCCCFCGCWGGISHHYLWPNTELCAKNAIVCQSKRLQKSGWQKICVFLLCPMPMPLAPCTNMICGRQFNKRWKALPLLRNRNRKFCDGQLQCKSWCQCTAKVWAEDRGSGRGNFNCNWNWHTFNGCTSLTFIFIHVHSGRRREALVATFDFIRNLWTCQLIACTSD